MSRQKHRKSEVVITLALVFCIVFFSGWLIFKGLNFAEEEIILEKPVEQNRREVVKKETGNSSEIKEKSGDFLEEVVEIKKEEIEESGEVWREIYPNTKPIKIGEVVVEASLARSITEQILGLSNTPYLPENVVKFFMFSVDSDHPIWMKDMNYALDVMWVNKSGEIVFIQKNVTPETFPEAFSSPVPARYVVEAAAGFVEKNNIKIGSKVMLLEE